MSKSTSWFLSVMILTVGGIVAAQPSNRFADEVRFVNYRPVVVFDLENLPPAIQAKARSHLADRVGPDFASRFKFTKAQVVNRRDLKKVEPTANAERLHDFDLHFWFGWPEKGIGSYAVSLKLDHKGKLLEPIDVPAIRKHPEKASIIGLDEARMIAVKNGFTIEGASVGIDYHRETDSFIWRFLRAIEHRKTSTVYDRVDISAESGKVITRDTLVAHST